MPTLCDFLLMVFAAFLVRGFVTEPAKIYFSKWRDKRREVSH